MGETRVSTSILHVRRNKEKIKFGAKLLPFGVEFIYSQLLIAKICVKVCRSLFFSVALYRCEFWAVTREERGILCFVDLHP
jgi:hypothetical protein